MAYESKIMDHLGLVAGMYDELGIGMEIDDHIPQDGYKRIISVGDAVKAMVLNGLGFVNQRLYLVPAFFENKPTDRLIGKGIMPEHLNDDVLGRALDSLYEYGVTELYSAVALEATKRLGLTSRFAHLDSSSFSVDGQYNSDESPAEGVIRITKGYSRDHRPDLNQLVLTLIAENQAGIPTLMKPLSGNSSDAGDFRVVVKEHVKQLQEAHHIGYLVADSALYNEETLKAMQAAGIKWITRVPATLAEAKAVLASVDLTKMMPLAEGYSYQALSSEYAGVAQRWLLIYSKAAHEAAQTQVRKELQRQSEADSKTWAKLMRQEFACLEDAKQALAAFEKVLKVCTLKASEIQQLPHYHSSGRPAKDAQPARFSYRIEGSLVMSLEVLQQRLVSQSCFILASNELDKQALPDHEVLTAYQGQAFSERGFRFLKDPMFLASSLFLKSPKRIMALMMVMTICLLVYAALQHRIRQSLSKHQQSFPDQKGKPTQKPTARWVFQCFVGIHLLIINQQQQLVLNLRDHQQQLLSLLGRRYQDFLFLKRRGDVRNVGIDYYSLRFQIEIV
jgi:transposase